MTAPTMVGVLGALPASPGWYITCNNRLQFLKDDSSDVTLVNVDHKQEILSFVNWV